MEKRIVNLSADGRWAGCKAKLNKAAVRKLYWTFEPDGGDNTKLELLPLDARAGFLGGVEKVAMMTDEDGKCDHDVFRLSVAGLDRFKVSVSLKPDGSDKKTSAVYEVWRQIYFSIRYMDPAFVPALDPVKAEYKKHGTVAKDVPPSAAAKIAHQEIISARDCYKLIWPVSKPHQEARVLLVDKIRNERRGVSIKRTSDLEFTLASGEMAQPTPWFVWDGPGEFARGLVRLPHGFYDFTKHIQRMGDRSLKVKIPADDPSHDTIAAAAKGGALKWEVDVRFAKFPNGFARPELGFIVIANRGRKGGPRPEGGRQGTMIHEMGHGFGLVAKEYQKYNEHTGKPFPAPTKNPTYYDRGSGGHCNTGAGGTAPDYEKGKCVMFHAGHDQRPKEFCSSCAPLVKKADLAPAKMPWPGS